MFELKDVLVYTIVDDYLKNCKHYQQAKCSAFGKPVKLTDSEIIYIYVMSCMEYGGNLDLALQSLYRHRVIKQELSRSQYNRRLHRLSGVIYEIFGLLSEICKNCNTSYAIDSFPLPVCHNIRISRCKLVQGCSYRGYNSSKRVYYYGFKVHLIVACDGSIVEFDFFPAAHSDIASFGLLGFDLPEKSSLYADKAYNHYQREDELIEAGIDFQPIRKENSKKPDNCFIYNWLKSDRRKHVETQISVLESRFSRTIHAVTQAGFFLKVIGFIIAHNLYLLLK